MVLRCCESSWSLPRTTAAVALGALGLLAAWGRPFCGAALPTAKDMPEVNGCVTMNGRWLDWLIALVAR